MTKQSRFEGDISGEIEVSKHIEHISKDLFQKYENNCIICSDLPAETNANDLREFLDIFGQKMRMGKEIDKHWYYIKHGKK
ncbi:MAG: hypothetical protein EZS28_016734 [Streblomastix strix]|uniref:Uncharacterized protein n=1 Tax=Streblomastix strix TaxID=222440 RepID=A0A5J4VZS5_9EUKA|nr:MAG: hypothetical protein EZS28_016734 [Streblomastix strix]